MTFKERLDRWDQGWEQPPWWALPILLRRQSKRLKGERMKIRRSAGGEAGDHEK